MTAWPKPCRRRKTRSQHSRDQVNAVRDMIFTRDGYRCVVDASEQAAQWSCMGELTIQHGIGKGAGGSMLFDTPDVLRTMCFRHNTLAESHHLFARACSWFGWSLPRNRVDITPTRYPVRYPDGRDYFLTGDSQRFLVGRDTALDIRLEAYPQFEGFFA